MTILISIILYCMVGTITMAVFMHFKWIDEWKNGDEDPTQVLTLIFWPIAWIVITCYGIYRFTRTILNSKITK